MAQQVKVLSALGSRETDTKTHKISLLLVTLALFILSWLGHLRQFLSLVTSWENLLVFIFEKFFTSNNRTYSHNNLGT